VAPSPLVGVRNMSMHMLCHVNLIHDIHLARVSALVQTKVLVHACA